MRVGELKWCRWSPVGNTGDEQPEVSSSGDSNGGRPKQTDSGDDSGLEANLTPDGLLEILSNRRRRFLWRLLRKESGELELNEVSRQIAALENGIDPEDVFGRIYEYFIKQFAMEGGQKGGEFYTPKSVVELMVEILEPYEGRIFDPFSGSGGMFVQIPCCTFKISSPDGTGRPETDHLSAVLTQ